MSLNREAIKNDFWENGFVKIENFYPIDLIEEIKAQLLRELKANLRSIPNSDKKFRDEKIEFITEVQRNFSPQFEALFQKSDLAKIIEELFGTSGLLHVSELILKRRKIGFAYRDHQDDFYFCVKGHEGINAWTPLDEASEENGGIYYYKGSHRDGLLDHKEVGPKDYSCHDLAQSYEKVNVVANPGDLLLHHCLTIHGSPPNISDKRRIAVSRVYRPQGASPDTGRANLRRKQDISTVLKYKWGEESKS